MKKFTYIIITALILSLTMGIASFAAEKPVITFTEDFKTMYFNDYEYYQMDLTGFESNVSFTYDEYYSEIYEYDPELGQDVLVSVENEYYNEENPAFANYKLSEAQKKTVSTIDIYGDEIIALVDVHFKDGGKYSLTLLREDYVDDYNSLKSNESNQYKIEYSWPEDNYVNATKNQLLTGKTKEIDPLEYLYDYEYVYINSEDGMLTYTPGLLWILDDTYYYVSYEENKITNEDDLFMMDKVILHEITDETVVEALKVAEDKYYADDYGYLYDDDLAHEISYVVLVTIFGVIPGFICLITFVFAFIKKKTYRKLLFATSAFLLLEIIVFAIFMVTTNFK